MNLTTTKAKKMKKSRTGISQLEGYLSKADDGKPGESLEETSTQELKDTHSGIMSRLKDDPENKALVARMEAVKGELQKRGKAMYKSEATKILEDYLEKGAMPHKKPIEKSLGESDIDLEKAKYTKRTGTPGNYKYEYSDGESGVAGGGAKAGPENKGSVLASGADLSELTDEQFESEVASLVASRSVGELQKMRAKVESRRNTRSGAMPGPDQPDAKPSLKASNLFEMSLILDAAIHDKEKQESKKPIEKSLAAEGPLTPAAQRRFTEHEHAAKVSQLVKGDGDVCYAQGVSTYAFTDDGTTDGDAAELAKSDAFYGGGDPSLARTRMPLEQTILCKSCDSSMPALLTACPTCGDNITTHCAIPKDLIKSEHAHTALLRRPQSTQDVHYGDDK